jgi:hypothetical protein
MYITYRNKVSATKIHAQSQKEIFTMCRCVITISNIFLWFASQRFETGFPQKQWYITDWDAVNVKYRLKCHVMHVHVRAEYIYTTACTGSGRLDPHTCDQWRTQDFLGEGEGYYKFSCGQRADRTGMCGLYPPSQTFRSICKWVKPVFLLGCYGCIFHGTGNSAQLYQNFRIGVGGTPQIDTMKVSRCHQTATHPHIYFNIIFAFSQWEHKHKIIFINCNWVVTRWQWSFNTYTKHETGLLLNKVGFLTAHRHTSWKFLFENAPRQSQRTSWRENA